MGPLNGAKMILAIPVQFILHVACFDVRFLQYDESYRKLSPYFVRPPGYGRFLHGGVSRKTLFDHFRV